MTVNDIKMDRKDCFIVWFYTSDQTHDCHSCPDLKKCEKQNIYEDILKDLLGHRGLTYLGLINYLISLEDKWRSKRDEL